MPAKKKTAPKSKPMPDVEKSLKVRVGQQIVGRIDVTSGPGGDVKEYRAFVAHPELGFEQVGVATSQQGGIDLVGNGLMRKLWSVSE